MEFKRVSLLLDSTVLILLMYIVNLQKEDEISGTFQTDLSLQSLLQQKIAHRTQSGRKRCSGEVQITYTYLSASCSVNRDPGTSAMPWFHQDGTIYHKIQREQTSLKRRIHTANNCKKCPVLVKGIFTHLQNHQTALLDLGECIYGCARVGDISVNMCGLLEFSIVFISTFIVDTASFDIV